MSEIVMTDAIQRFLERLQTGWQPTAEEIDRSIPQRDLVDWDFWKSGPTLIGYPTDDAGWKEVAVLWIDADLRWALASDGFWWLDRDTVGDYPREVVEDTWILDRDPDESDDEYAERCRILGCDSSGKLRLRRWQWWKQN
jgi:hypothetical protein